MSNLPAERMTGYVARGGGPPELNITREEMAHRRAAKAIDAAYEFERQGERVWAELQAALLEELETNRTEMKPRFGAWATRAYQEFQVQAQVEKERRA